MCRDRLHRRGVQQRVVERAVFPLVDAGGATLETGAMSVGWAARPTTVDFTSSTGLRRLGLYDIVSETMRLSVGAPGGSRPASLSAPSIYITQK